MTNKIFALFLFLMGTAYICAFVYDIEYDQDLMTWLWLLSFQICFIVGLRFRILDDKIKHK